VLMSQTIINSSYFEDRYSYDSLNRVTAVSEYLNGATLTGSQQYTYDRWGNRTINPASTFGLNKQFTVDTATNRLGVPVGLTGTMTYDTAGNLVTDTYTGTGARTYDADNRMLTAADNTGQTSRYTYNADGQRVRAQVASSQEKWYLYGFDGELLAEYSANLPASSPEKENGYRNGELLITATGRFNVALAANGAVASASSAHTCCGFSTTGAINGNNRGPWGNGEGWNDATENQVPDWIQVDFAGSKTIDEISVFSLHDNYTQENTPSLTQTFTLYGLLAFDVQYWNGSTWVTVPGGSVTGNNKVWRKFTFSPITTSKIRVYINAVPDSWSRVVEIQAFGASAGGEKIQWLVSDRLGTPRIIIDQSGSLTNVKRHDYLPFGEELFAPAGGRSAALGYTAGDAVRQQFTQKERDVETGLDYLNARYYASVQGRFTSTDRIFISDSQVANPQLWNLYNYVGNNPLNATDPTGMEVVKLGEHTDNEIDKRMKAIDEERKAIRNDSSLTKAQQDEKRAKLQAEKRTLELEREGNKIVSQYLAKLDSIGELNGLQLSDFSLTTDPVKDFASDPAFIKAFGGDVKKAEAAAKGNAGTGMFVWLGFSTQMFVNATSNDYKGSKGQVSGVNANDFITYGATAARHEQTHFGTDNSEHAAYTVQLRILQKFGPTAFKTDGFYDNALKFVTTGSKRKD